MRHRILADKKSFTRSGRGLSRRGAAIVEMAIVLPIFLTLILGIIEFGRAFMVSELMSHAARRGARMGVISGTSNEAVVAAVQQFLKDSGDIAEANVAVAIDIAPATGNVDPLDDLSKASLGDIVTVTVTVPHDKVGYVAAKWLSGTELRQQTAMAHE